MIQYMQAVILAAGRGERLRPLTDTNPKCLTLIGGKTILEYELDALDAAGIKECTIVVGYRANQVIEHYGPSFKNLTLHYVRNPDFATTNNLYSLWLARDRLQSQTILIEGDLLFYSELISRLVNLPGTDIAVVDKFQEGMNGTIVRGHGPMISEFVLKSAQGESFDFSGVAKTVNLYKFSKLTMIEHFLPALSRYVGEQNTNIFYEAVLAELVSKKSLQMGMMFPGDCPWFEIDTTEDLRAAQELFYAP